MDTGILIIRVVVGLYVAGHGVQKLFGWFDGPGLGATIGGMGSGLGFRPARLWVMSLSATEVVGGLLMAIGLLGPLGPIAVAGAMLGAAVFAHWSKGPWGAKGGYELAATNLAVALAVALLGVGSFSVDA
jgi:putative oxidoreductase